MLQSRHLSSDSTRHRHRWRAAFVAALVVWAVLAGCRSADDELITGGDGWVVLAPIETPDELPPTRPPADTVAARQTAPPQPTVTLLPDVTIDLRGADRSGQRVAGDGGDKMAPADAITDGDCDKDNCVATPVPSPTPGAAGADAPPAPTAAPTTVRAADAPRFHSTPIEPWSEAAFATALNDVEYTLREFVLNWGPILRLERERNRGDCSSFATWHRVWYVGVPAFTDVPENRAALYYEYRVILLTAHERTLQIQRTCGVDSAQEGDWRGTDLEILSYFEFAHARVLEMITAVRAP